MTLEHVIFAICGLVFLKAAVSKSRPKMAAAMVFGFVIILAVVLKPETIDLVAFVSGGARDGWTNWAPIAARQARDNFVANSGWSVVGLGNALGVVFSVIVLQFGALIGVFLLEVLAFVLVGATKVYIVQLIFAAWAHDKVKLATT